MTTPATIVGARPGCRPVTSSRSASGIAASCGAHPLDRLEREPVAVDQLGVVGVELLVDRRQRGRRAGDPDPEVRRASAAPSSASSISPRTSPASSSSSAASGGSWLMWRSVWRTGPGLQRGVEADLGPVADHELGRAAADVDHQRLLRRRRARRRRRRRSAAPPRRRRGSRRRGRSARAARPGTSRGWRRRGRRWSRSRSPARPELLVDRRCSAATAAQTSSIASAASWPEVSTPRPSRVTVERRSSSRTRPSTTSATSSRVEFVPMSTTATLTRTHPRAANSNRLQIAATPRLGPSVVASAGRRGERVRAAGHPPHQSRRQHPQRGGDAVGARHVALGLAARARRRRSPRRPSRGSRPASGSARARAARPAGSPRWR